MWSILLENHLIPCYTKQLCVRMKTVTDYHFYVQISHFNSWQIQSPPSKLMTARSTNFLPSLGPKALNVFLHLSKTNLHRSWALSQIKHLTNKARQRFVVNNEFIMFSLLRKRVECHVLDHGSKAITLSSKPIGVHRQEHP